jgi:hypothetical protein
MCNLKTRYAGKEGYVLQCAECRRVQIGFGTTMLCLSPVDFNALSDLVAYRMESLVPFGDDKKAILLPTPSSVCQILLTEKELEMLHHMLQSADDEMRTEALLQLFQS